MNPIVPEHNDDPKGGDVRSKLTSPRGQRRRASKASGVEVLGFVRLEPPHVPRPQKVTRNEKHVEAVHAKQESDGAMTLYTGRSSACHTLRSGASRCRGPSPWRTVRSESHPM